MTCHERIASQAPVSITGGLIVSLFLLVSSGSGLAAERCADWDIDHTTPRDQLLTRYFVAEGDVGGRGCWVHPHPNGKDAVVTPNSWGQTPNAGRQGLVDEALEAITEASAVYSAWGSVDSQLYLLLTDKDPPSTYTRAQALWIRGGRCWMEAFQQAGWGHVGGARRAHLKSTFAHEIGHCFLMENFELDESDFTDFDRWWDESGSEFLASQVYPTANAEHVRARLFDLDGREFMQPYNAMVLWQHLANEAGTEAALEELYAAYDNGGGADSYRSYLSASSLDERFHDFNRRHFATTVRDPGGGNLPTESTIAAQFEQTLDTEFGFIEVEAVNPRRLNRVKLTLPKSFNVTVRAPSNVNSIFHASLHAFMAFHDDWENGIELVGSCEQDTSIDLLLTTLEKKSVTDLKFHYTLETIADCACEDMPELDACLLGGWTMSKSSLLDMFGDDGTISGRVWVHFSPGGGMIRQFSDVENRSIHFYPSGKEKVASIHKYRGAVRGCVTVHPQGTRLDGAMPMKSHQLNDGVRRYTYIAHDGRTTTDKWEDGLESWFWPHTPAFVRCDGDTLHIGRRIYHR